MAIVSRGLKRVGGFGIAAGAIDGGLTYYDRRAQHPEESTATSLAYAGAEVALWTFLPGVAMAKEAFGLAKMAGQSGMFSPQKYESRAIARNDIGGSWNYQDTQQAATMRQRGLDAIANSRMNARSALGGEARALHRNRGY